MEELLRYVGPVQYNVRYTLREAHVPSGVIPAHKPVFLMKAAANRDSRAFDDAETFDITRDRTQAQNLGLGYGIHSCLGAALARMETAIALEHLLDFMPRYEVDFDGLERVHMQNVAGTTMSRFGYCDEQDRRRFRPVREQRVCMGIIPEVFDLDDEDYLHVLTDEVTPENEERVKEAVRQCPRQAISIREE